MKKWRSEDTLKDFEEQRKVLIEAGKKRIHFDIGDLDNFDIFNCDNSLISEYRCLFKEVKDSYMKYVFDKIVRSHYIRICGDSCFHDKEEKDLKCEIMQGNSIYDIKSYISKGKEKLKILDLKLNSTSNIINLVIYDDLIDNDAILNARFSLANYEQKQALPKKETNSYDNTVYGGNTMKNIIDLWNSCHKTIDDEYQKMSLDSDYITISSLRKRILEFYLISFNYCPDYYHNLLEERTPDKKLIKNYDWMKVYINNK